MKSARQQRAERKKERAEKRRRRQTWAGAPEERVWVNPKLLGPSRDWRAPEFLKRGYYVDQPFTCRLCGKAEVWTATQQKWWYEVAKGDTFTTCSRCRACRRKAREHKAVQRDKLREAIGLPAESKMEDTTMAEMLPHTEQDDLRFIRLLRNILGKSLAAVPPEEVYVVRIDGWFDAKWRGFSGKVLGARGVWRCETTLPPFHPHRVLDESHWTTKPGSKGWRKTLTARLHVEQNSEQNTRRIISRITSSGVFFWYTAGTSHLDRGAAMLYRQHEGQIQTWHAEFPSVCGWRKLGHHKGISTAEISMLME